MIASPPADSLLTMPPRRRTDDEVPEQQHSSVVDVNRLSFPLQVVILIVSIVLAAAGSNWISAAGLRSDIRSIRQDQEQVGRALADIRAQLPNKEALDLRLASYDERIKKAESRLEMQETYLQNLRERLAERGWKP